MSPAIFKLDTLPLPNVQYRVDDVIEVRLVLRVIGVRRLLGDTILEVGEPEQVSARHRPAIKREA